MSRRTSLADLIGDPAVEPDAASDRVVAPDDAQQPAATVGEPGAGKPAPNATQGSAVHAPVAPAPAPRRRKAKVVAPPPEPVVEVPRYLRMERIEARLHPDQADALSDLARRLNRVRRGRGERITTNTLLRVAADLLLAREAEVSGYTEADLSVALGLAPRD